MATDNHPKTSSEECVVLEIDHATLPAGLLVGSPHRLTDSWAPSTTVLVTPPWLYKRHSLSFCFRRGAMRPSRSGRLTTRLFRYRRNRDLVLPDSLLGFDCRHDCTANIAHALMGQIGVALLGLTAANLDRRAADLVFILHSNTPRFVVRLYELLGFKVVADSFATIHGEHFDMTPQKLPLRALAARAIRSHAISCGLLSDSDRLRDPLFIARRKRTLVNLEQVQRILQHNGYRTIFAEDHSVEDQIQMIANAESIFGLHGAALGHLMFRSPLSRGTVIEAFSCGYITNLYRSICHYTFDSWFGILGDMDGTVVSGMLGSATPRAFQELDYRLDPSAVETVLAMSKQAEGSGREATFEKSIGCIPSVVVDSQIGADGSLIRDTNCSL